MQVSPVMWWRSWAKKEFASSRSIGRIDSSRERIWRRADGTDEERRRLVIESLGAGRNSKSPRADCLGLRTSLLTPCRTKNRVFTRPKGWKVAKTSRIKVSRGPIVAQPTTKGEEGSFGRFGITSSPISTLPNPRAPRLIFIHVEPCLSKVISRSVNVSNVYNPYALHFVTRIGKNFLYHGN